MKNMNIKSIINNIKKKSKYKKTRNYRKKFYRNEKYENKIYNNKYENIIRIKMIFT